MLDNRPDGPGEVLGTGGGGTRHLEDVTGQHQASHVGADERRTQLTPVAGQDIADRREDERAEDVTKQPAGLVVGQAGPEHGKHLLADFRVVLPQPDNSPDELFSRPLGILANPGEGGHRIHRRLQRRGKEPVLAAEVVVDQRWVDAGAGGHGAHGGALEPEFREQFPGGVQDGPARVRAAQPAPASGGH